MIKGKYPHKVILERPITADDTYGGQTVTWQRFGLGRCWIGTTGGREILQHQQLQNPKTYIIGMAYRDDLLPTYRLTDEVGNRYNIRSVINVNGLNKTLEIIAESGTA